MKYKAREDYQSTESARNYEQRSMYSGLLGRRRVKIEQGVVASLVAEMDQDSSVLDCPCGNGRWMSVLAQRASRIVGIDVSTGMVSVAKDRAVDLSVLTEINVGDAENIELPDNSVDYTFSYALMKHLPLPVQYKVLAEFSRVTRKRVICSFAILYPVSWTYWRRRRQVDSYPLIPEELEFMANSCDLKLSKLVKVSQPIVGLEYFAVFDKSS